MKGRTMIKIDRRSTAKTEAAKHYLQNAKVRNWDYNTREVNSALQEIFFGKCYICENKDVTSYQIEHLVSHRGDVELKYDWNNMFLSCAHCNNTKLGKYDQILDCSVEDVDEMIAFRKRGYFGTQEELEFVPLYTENEKVVNTVKLLKDVYYGISPQKEMEAKIIRRKLRKELSEFKEYIREYSEAEDENEKEDLFYQIKKELRPSSAFTAFKRWLIKDNHDFYPELATLI